MFNPNWARWIMASVSNHFNTVAAAIPLPFMVDGVDEIIAEDQHTDHAELRVTGPFITEVSKDRYRFHVDVNILITDLMNETGENAYDLQTWCGAFQVGMDGPIMVYKYGSESGDDSAYIGCLSPRQGKYDANKVLHYGQINKVDRIRQSMIDGKFQMTINST